MGKALLCGIFIMLHLMLTPVFAKDLVSETATDAVEDCIAHMDQRVKEEDGQLYLKLSSCALEDSHVPTVVEFLKNHTHVTGLNLSGNKISDNGALAIAELKTLAVLDLMNNQIGPVGADALAGMTLTALNLSENDVGDDGAIAIAHKNATMRELFLRSNHIGPNGMAALASNDSLVLLDVRDNQIGGGFALTSDALSVVAKNKMLQALAIGQNSLTDEDVILLSTSQTITQLEIGNNLFGSEGVAALAGNKNFSWLGLSNSHIDDTGAMALANNTSLLGIEMNNNLIRDKGAIAFAKNKTLRMLDVSHNHIGAAGLAALANNRTIKELYVDGNVGDESDACCSIR